LTSASPKTLNLQLGARSDLRKVPERGRKPLRYPLCLAILCPLKLHLSEWFPGLNFEHDHPDSCPPTPAFPTERTLPHPPRVDPEFKHLATPKLRMP